MLRPTAPWKTFLTSYNGVLEIKIKNRKKKLLKSNKASKTCRNQFYIYNKRNGKFFGVFFPRPPPKKRSLCPRPHGRVPRIKSWWRRCGSWKAFIFFKIRFYAIMVFFKDAFLCDFFFLQISIFLQSSFTSIKNKKLLFFDFFLTFFKKNRFLPLPDRTGSNNAEIEK